MPHYDDLVSLVEISEIFGVKKTTAYIWRSRDVLPEPDLVIGGQTPAWERARILAWAEETGRVVVDPDYKV